MNQLVEARHAFSITVTLEQIIFYKQVGSAFLTESTDEEQEIDIL